MYLASSSCVDETIVMESWPTLTPTLYRLGLTLGRRAETERVSRWIGSPVTAAADDTPRH